MTDKTKPDGYPPHTPADAKAVLKDDVFDLPGEGSEYRKALRTQAREALAPLVASGKVPPLPDAE